VALEVEGGGGGGGGGGDAILRWEINRKGQLFRKVRNIPRNKIPIVLHKKRSKDEMQTPQSYVSRSYFVQLEIQYVDCLGGSAKKKKSGLIPPHPPWKVNVTVISIAQRNSHTYEI